MPLDYETKPPKSSGRIAFYTHTTDLSTKNNPTFHITSNKYPELRPRLPTTDDTLALLALFSDERNTKYNKSCNGLNTPSAIDGLIRKWQDVGHPFERLNCVVTIDGELIGTGGLGWIGCRKSDGKRIADAGMMLHPEFRGRGYAYEALCMIVKTTICLLQDQAIYGNPM